MKIAIVHNEYKQFSGEEAVVCDMRRVLEDGGDQVCMFVRRSADIPHMRAGKLQAFAYGIYNPFVKKEFHSFLLTEKPDVVHIHNLYPLISPSILPLCKKAKIPVVMTVHNYRLMCPGGLFYRHGKICEDCASGQEWRSVRNNCQNSHFKTLGYALRNWVARVFRLYVDNVTLFLALTEFQRQKLIQFGLPAEKIRVLPNMVELPKMDGAEYSGPSYVAFAGRLNMEKGIDTLLNAAELTPEINYKIAGRDDIKGRVFPANVEYVGVLPKAQMMDFLRNSRLVVFPSEWYETFGLVMVEALSLGKPVIGSNMAGIPEIIRDGQNGLLFRSGDAADLAEKIKTLFANDLLCDTLSQNGFAIYQNSYSSGVYRDKLMEVYNRLLIQ